MVLSVSKQKILFLLVSKESKDFVALLLLMFCSLERNTTSIPNLFLITILTPLSNFNLTRDGQEGKEDIE